jgi:hypothetical protein
MNTATAELRSRPLLDARYDRVVAALTRRLAAAAQTAREEPPTPAAHDFLVPLLRPDLLDHPVELPAR